MDLLASDGGKAQTVMDWSIILSKAESQLLSIARALIVNFELTIFPEPTLHMNAGTANKVFGVLRELVEKRGIAIDAPVADRQPRTCIITDVADDAPSSKICDHVFSIGEGGISRVNVGAAQPERK